jgi:hypothetical protein
MKRVAAAVGEGSTAGRPVHEQLGQRPTQGLTAQLGHRVAAKQGRSSGRLGKSHAQGFRRLVSEEDALPNRRRLSRLWSAGNIAVGEPELTVPVGFTTFPGEIWNSIVFGRRARAGIVWYLSVKPPGSGLG